MLEPTSILTAKQLQFLKIWSISPFSNDFYLSGGTALCGFYIPYRKSEDLDFFSKNEIHIQDLSIWLNSARREIGFDNLDIQTSFNRNLVFLKYRDETLKTEFTYYPFPNKKHERYLNVAIDSVEDIALNKLFTIYQKSRLRDFMDLFMIIQKYDYEFAKLRLDAKMKFDWDIDPIQLGSQLIKVTERKDVPILVESFDYKKMEKFFQDISLSLKTEVLK